MLSKADIDNYLNDKNLLQKDSTFIWATIGKKYFIISFSKNEVCVLPVGPMGNFTGKLYQMEKQTLEIIELKKKTLGFGYNLIIKPYEEKKKSFTIRPVIVGFKEQKDNIETIKSMYFSDYC